MIAPGGRATRMAGAHREGATRLSPGTLPAKGPGSAARYVPCLVRRTGPVSRTYGGKGERGRAGLSRQTPRR